MGKDPDFLGLGGYHGSDSGEASSSGTSSSEDSDDQSLDSAELRAAEAQQRLKDFGESHQELRATTKLPSAADAFDEVSRPAFLDPEATRPLAVSSTHGLASGAGAAAAGGQGRGPRGKAAASADFDVSRLAPALKGQQQQTDKRGPPGAVIEGKAKRYKLEDGPEATQQYTAAQIAMMGGNAEQLLQEQQEQQGGKAARGPATKPMEVTEFLDKGLGGAVLPRKQQDRKDKEKLKRAAGQSTHAQWKTEAEMFESRVSEFTLPNGLHFIVLERHNAPVVSCHTHARVGAYVEEEGSTGLAHLLEHMAFKGTPRIGSRDWRAEQPLLAAQDEVFYELRQLQQQAAASGASASRSSHMQQLQERLDKLKVEAQQLVVPNAFGSMLQEAGAVGLNAATSHDNTRYYMSLPANKLELWFALESERFQVPVLRELYTEKEVIGEERRARWENNPMGRFTYDYLLQALDNPYRRPVIGFADDFDRFGSHEVASFFSRYYHPANLTISVVAADVLTGGRSARLIKQLVLRGSCLSASVLVGYPGDLHPGLALVTAVPPAGGDMQRFSTELQQQLDALAQDGPTPAELGRVKASARAALLSALTSNGSMSSLLASYHSVTGSWRGVLQELADVDSLRGPEVAEVAGQVFGEENRFTGLGLPL
ncbi:hypothetical protein OEZ86_008139 [Tetradesmus obliquus]|nr:hypothetical protein OEZ86_008139 [Tetradesmus obliquus]